jgi:serpin B
MRVTCTRGRNLLALAACTLAFVLGACEAAGSSQPIAEARSNEARVTSPMVTSGDLSQLAADNRHFAVDLYQAVRPTPGNIVFSPESISIALAMTYGGAAGMTATQMKTVLDFSLPPDRVHPAFDALDLSLNSAPRSGTTGAFQLSVANALWAQKGVALLPTYLDLLAQNYGTGVFLLDFATATESARSTINQWVSGQTHGKISNLVDSLDPSTRLILTNAVYFKADWAAPFMSDSANGTFQSATGPVTVPMMQGPTAIPLWAGLGYQAAELKYAGGSTSMILIVPDPGTFEAFETGLTTDQLNGILTASPASPGQLSMPRFNFAQSIPLTNTLGAMGMPDAFNSSIADFSDMDGGHDLYVHDVVHKALIAVDENGTEAAAATEVGTVVVVVVRPPTSSLVVDRPFLFLIRDNATSTILFLGRVADPSK